MVPFYNRLSLLFPFLQRYLHFTRFLASLVISVLSHIKHACFFLRGVDLLISFIIWLAPRAGKMNQIARCEWLPERARWSNLARSGMKRFLYQY